jgi:hypothetical protein
MASIRISASLMHSFYLSLALGATSLPRSNASRVSARSASLTTERLPSRNLLDEPEELSSYLGGGSNDWAFYRQLDTTQGPLVIKSRNTSVDGTTLLIDDVHVFPKDVPKVSIGFKEVKTAYQSLVNELGTVGFERVIIRGQRISGAKFVNNASNKIQTITLTPQKPKN